MIRADLLTFHDTLSVAEALSQGRCPACRHPRTAFCRTEDGMWVCDVCTEWAYRDLRTGRVLYPYPTQED